METLWKLFKNFTNKTIHIIGIYFHRSCIEKKSELLFNNNPSFYHLCHLCHLCGLCDSNRSRNHAFYHPCGRSSSNRFSSCHRTCRQEKLKRHVYNTPSFCHLCHLCGLCDSNRSRNHAF